MIERRIDDKLFFVNGVTSPQNLRPESIRLPEKVEALPPLKEQVQGIRFRFFFQDKVILKAAVIQNSKPVAFLFAFIEEIPPIAPQCIAVTLNRTKPQSVSAPAVDFPGWIILPQAYHAGKIKHRL
jgi:hypothetical protein